MIFLLNELTLNPTSESLSTQKGEEFLPTGNTGDLQLEILPLFFEISRYYRKVMIPDIGHPNGSETGLLGTENVRIGVVTNIENSVSFRPQFIRQHFENQRMGFPEAYFT
jgi:hypothetical protein